MRLPPHFAGASAENGKQSLSLQHISYDGEVSNGNFCKMVLTQHYQNLNPTPVDVVYKFPTGSGMVIPGGLKLNRMIIYGLMVFCFFLLGLRRISSQTGRRDDGEGTGERGRKGKALYPVGEGFCAGDLWEFRFQCFFFPAF